MILILPVFEMRMFSILRSVGGGGGGESGEHTGMISNGTWNKVWATIRYMYACMLTSVNDAVPMAVLERTTDLSCEFSGCPLAKTSMADDVVEHLSTVDVFKDHIIVVRMNDHLSHTADVRMVQQ